MQVPDLAIRELGRCVGDLGLSGVQIGSHVNDWNLDHPALFPIFQAAERLGAAVFVHPWDMLAKDRMGKYWLGWLVGMPAETSLAICSLIFGGVLERLPKLRIAFAHGGGAFPGTIGRIEHGFRVRPDLCAVDCGGNPRSYLDRIYVDSLVHDANALRHLVKLVVPSRGVGIGLSLSTGRGGAGKLIESLEFSEADRNRLLAGTALNSRNRLAKLRRSVFVMQPTAYQPDEAFARHLDDTDPLRCYRNRFLIPRRSDGRPLIYFCGHSLGLQPRTVRAAIEQELDDWANLAVEAHFRGRKPWYSYHEQFRDPRLGWSAPAG